MDVTLLEQLLYEDESATLDFKKEQYRFDGGSEDDRSELLKDILGFANGWRRAEAYILIGVEEIRGDRSNVLGISDHLVDHVLQQFVNSRTNKPIQFSYEVCPIDSKQIGVIRIERQPRPFYLKKDYGKLEREKVYIRRGSSTDPSKPAMPEEIVLMGQAAHMPLPDVDLTVEFADSEFDDIIGAELSLTAEMCDMPEPEDVPELVDHAITKAFYNVHDIELNPHFYTQVATYEFVRRLYRKIRIVVTNVGQIAANDVRLEVSINTGTGLGFAESSQHPKRPEHHRSRYDMAALASSGGIRSHLSGREPGNVTIEIDDKRIKLAMICGNLQPGRKIFSDEFYTAIGKSGQKEFICHLYAANLPKPRECSLTIVGNITKTSMSVDDLVKLAHSQYVKKKDD